MYTNDNRWGVNDNLRYVSGGFLLFCYFWVTVGQELNGTAIKNCRFVSCSNKTFDRMFL